MYYEVTEKKRWHEDESLWLRRGHTRKPNRVVLALYKLFDLIGDFGPMFAAFFRFIKRTVMGTWELLVRFVLTVVNIAILAGILYVSVGHSYDFLTVYAGMSGVSAWVFVAVWETVFIYCSTLIDIKYRKGKKSNWADWTGFLMGWVFVEVSNYMGMAENLFAKIVGLATPILLLVMKKVLQKQFSKEERKKRSWLSSFFIWIVSRFERKASTIEQQPQVQPQTVEQPTEKTVADPVENAVGFTGETVAKTVENAVEKPVENLPQNRVEPVENSVGNVVAETVENTTANEGEKEKETAGEMVEKSTANAVAKTTEQVDENLPVEMAQNPDVSTDSADIESPENGTISVEEKEAVATGETVGEPVEKAVVETVGTAVENDAVEDQKTNRDPVENPVEKATANEEKNDQKTVEQPTKKATKRTLKKDNNLKLKKSIKRWALDYFQKNGKPPGRVIIEKEFGMNQNQARLVANEIKKELGIKAS